MRAAPGRAQGAVDDPLVVGISRLVAAAAGPGDAIRAVVEALQAARPGWDWVGVYLLRGDELALAAHVGADTEHTRIPVGRGVCGTAVATGQTQRIDDVLELDNYLACSVGTRSELVVLIRHDGRIVGQFDIDSDQVATFTAADEALLERIGELVAPACSALVAA